MAVKRGSTVDVLLCCRHACTGYSTGYSKLSKQKQSKPTKAIAATCSLDEKIIMVQRRSRTQNNNQCLLTLAYLLSIDIYTLLWSH